MRKDWGLNRVQLETRSASLPAAPIGHRSDHNVPCRANGQPFLNPLPLCQHDLAAVAPDTHVHLYLSIYQFIKIGLRVGAELSKQGETCWKRPMPRRPRKVPPISGA